MNRPLRVVLAGGLGNQLFQIACAISLTENEIHVISCLCQPRGSNELPDSQHFVFPSRVYFKSCNKAHKLSTRIGSLLLSMTQRRNYLNRSFLIRHPVYFLCAVVLSFHFRQFLYPRVGNGIGYDESISRRRGNLVIGYFQSYLYLKTSGRMDEFSAIRLVEESETFLKVKRDLVGDSLILIHVRLGDYKLEKAFGVLPKGYFAQALKLFSHGKETISPKVFSDENSLALDLLSELSIGESSLVDTSNLTPAETMELMRGFDKYIISNSTFSWWGAFLSHSTAACVVFPTPWFKHGPSPRSLAPQNWVSVERC